MDDSHNQSGREDVKRLGDQALGEVPRSEPDLHYLRGAGRRTRKRASLRWQAVETRGQAAASGQFALCDKGCAPGPMVLKGVGGGKEKDGEQLDGQKTEIRGQRSEDRDQRAEGSGSRTTGLLTTGLRAVGGRRWEIR